MFKKVQIHVNLTIVFLSIKKLKFEKLEIRKIENPKNRKIRRKKIKLNKIEKSILVLKKTRQIEFCTFINFKNDIKDDFFTSNSMIPAPLSSSITEDGKPKSDIEFAI